MDILIATKASQMEKRCATKAFSSATNQLAVFRRAPDIFQLAKNALVDTRYLKLIFRHMAY